MSAKLTLLKVDDEIASYLRERGVSNEGNRFLEAAYILKQAGILDHLLLMHENKVHEQSNMLDMINKSVQIGWMLKGNFSPEASLTDSPVNQAVEPEPDDDEPPMFGA